MPEGRGKDHGFLHRGIRSDGGRRGERRKVERCVIRGQDRDDEVKEERKGGRKKAVWEREKTRKREIEEARGRQSKRDSSS